MSLVPLNHVAVRACLGRRHSLPTLPDSFSKLLRVTSNPNARIQDLVEIIAFDPILMANVLRVANSSFMGFPQYVEDLSEAVVLLGMDEVRRIALSVGSFDVFGTRGVSSSFLRNIWLHSVTTAMVSQQMATRGQFVFADEAYLAGLLHDLGKLFFATFYPAAYAPLRAEVCSNRGNELQLESEIFGMTHLDAAGVLCEHWHLPTSVLVVAGNHHDPTAAPEENRRLSLCVATANVLSHNILQDQPVEHRMAAAHLWLRELAQNSDCPEMLTPNEVQGILLSCSERARGIGEFTGAAQDI